MTQPGRITLSQNRRFLVQEDGTPFLYLGDTAWEMFSRLTWEEVDLYLQDRADKGFTVIQVVILSELGGGDSPNVYGEPPLVNSDPSRPNEAYFRNVDEVIGRAEARNLYLGLVPTWASYVTDDDQRIFDSSNAYRYGQFLGERYGDRTNIFWLLGGDRNPIWDGMDYRDVWQALAAGLREQHQGRQLMTFHPRGDGCSSSMWFHQEDWLDFNMMQTGPRRNLPNYERISQDYQLGPVKPTLDGEPGYEGAHPHINPANGRLTDYDVRKYAYWALFAGACGHTYGCLEIWQMWQPGQEPKNGARIPWPEALHLAGATQMSYARRLLESRPFLSRVPDQSLLASPEGAGENRVQATRCTDGSYGLVYISSAQSVLIRLDKLSGPRLNGYWYDPRNGTATIIGQFANTGNQRFTPPSSGPDHDWVLVLDDVGSGYPVPGSAYAAR